MPLFSLIVMSFWQQQKTTLHCIQFTTTGIRMPLSRLIVNKSMSVRKQKRIHCTGNMFNGYETIESYPKSDLAISWIIVITSIYNNNILILFVCVRIHYHVTTVPITIQHCWPRYYTSPSLLIWLFFKSLSLCAAQFMLVASSFPLRFQIWEHSHFVLITDYTEIPIIFTKLNRLLLFVSTISNNWWHS